ncbi:MULTISPECIES: hypothetical protein [Brevundimonas]|uniref:hypothetical protein n=1 Tax=Brevundimonas TaxID=41275 RepID=UPI0018F6C4A0|nr:hypothetical protein [Brevundimonas sp. LPMIX5]
MTLRIRPRPDRILPIAFAVGVIASSPASAQSTNLSEPLTIEAQGSFTVGGRVARTPGVYENNAPTAAGQSFHGDHLYAFYQIPESPRALPIVMLHGAFQSARSWETTPDGREGFQTLFLRRGFPVYLVDQPRRGRAGASTVAATIEPTPNDQLFFDQFRIGRWPKLSALTTFSSDRKSIVWHPTEAANPAIANLILKSHSDGCLCAACLKM